ncbi:tetratricopeptide repeat protein [Winogradskyella immobilis]|uniref:Tetratricopeptide repeat protein n=1 Tax=Winogradskyella immobilis TaxID=2816852 RepID=A0ABS8EMV0_9FLAO|nr:tetratricopeptide repeat protein [Winogradskyella immobilis]MCC1484554.1 tetratricopeptide repeat protein [Winogradskyella immobilis]MCG0016646.1 tetratricopeptide repeat protein [Winogradskyella immobilis]
MRKLITLMCAILISSMSYAQKNEIKALEKALKSNNFAAAKTSVASADALIGNMDDKTKAKFYFLKAQALYASGAGTNDDISKAIKSLDDLKDLESKVGKLKYTEEANTIKASMLQNFLQRADKALTNKNYLIASKNFETAYKLSPKDTTYLYYAASTAVNAQDYETSLAQYLQLKNMGYTGIKTNYLATNKETGVEENFSDKKTRDIAIVSKTYINPRVELSKSKSAEIIKNIALIYVAQNENEKAIAAMADARKENPNDLGLILSEANVQLKMGNRDKFKDLMEIATTMDPENAELQFNLGALAAEGGNVDSAKKYYKKAIELDPNYADAYTNMAVAILNGELAIVEEMNGLGSSSADNERYDTLLEKRKGLYSEAIPFLEKALELNKTNVEAARTLMNIYSTLGETDKFKAMKAKVAELDAKASGN